MRRTQPTFSEAGFTLVEVILIFVIGSLLAAIIAPYVRTAVSGSATPVAELRNSFDSYETMELLTADYRSRYDAAQDAGTAVDLSTFKTAIGTGSQNNAYGVYTVIESKFIQFVGGNEQASAATTFLKVKISDANGITYTTLFANR